MKVIVLLLSFLCFTIYSFSQLDSIGFELVYEHPNEVLLGGQLNGESLDTNLFGYKTWRLYAYCQNEDDFVSSYFGDIENPMFISVNEGGELYTSQLEGNEINSPLNAVFAQFFPAYNYSSFVSLGAIYSNEFGDFTSNAIDTEPSWIEKFTQDDRVFINSEVGGGMYTLISSENGRAGSDLKVPLGQFTANSDISAEMCIQVFINGIQPNSDNDYEHVSCQMTAHANSDCGCTDSNACNYDSSATIDTGICLYENDGCNDYNSDTAVDLYDADCNCIGYITGCVDTIACNYDSEADVDDGSCDYPFDNCVIDEFEGTWNNMCQCQFSLSGVVFIDDNFNGILDENETPLPYQTVSIPSEGIQIITDDSGSFQFIGLENGEYQMEVNYASEWTSYTTDTIQNVSFPQEIGNLIYFGVSSSDLPPPVVCAGFYQLGAGVPCNDILDYIICYRNMSLYPISGVVEVRLDPLLSYSSSALPDVTTEEQVVTWEFENLNVMSKNFDNIIVNTPNETHLGEWMISSVVIYAWFEDELIQIAEETIHQEVTCSYDPNDITGIPYGYTDEHWLLSDTRMEYLIRFQNTGNAPARTVMIVDTLDVNMDPSSFQLIANSHSVMTTLEPSGRIEFLFKNINLPDSTANEPESHGLVSFEIDFKDDISVGEEVNQTAYIFFDNNPAVVTNTTWHTIHECGGESEFSLEDTGCYSEYQTIEFQSNYEFLEEYNWFLDEELVSREAFTELELDYDSEYEMSLLVSNPICSEERSETIAVSERCIGDFDCNGGVTITDLTFFLGDFGCSMNCRADMNDDSFTTIVDLTILLSLFGENCE